MGHKQSTRGDRGESDLMYIDGNFYLGVTSEVEAAKRIETDDVIGVDLGVALDKEVNDPIAKARGLQLRRDWLP